MMARRACVLLLVICMGCSAQTPSSGTAPSKTAPAASSSSSPASTAAGSTAPFADVAQQIERQVRAHYSLPPDVSLLLGNLRSSEFPNYDELTITFVSADKKQTYEFMLSRDHKTLMRVTKMDLGKDPYAETMKKIDTSGRPTRGNKDAKVCSSTTTTSNAHSVRACTQRCFRGYSRNTAIASCSFTKTIRWKDSSVGFACGDRCELSRCASQ